ncbi:hypothetical protein BOW53_08170 [Solemya pervernicosa gill symbiont]|uniref:Chemoreceptor zinc-binding domain-containing protein n=2 Tax=Gammaproteobacteria incertae sedis TaxID=118884 RepID=A0A1T2L5E9_9GAMM|nr:CZB domain-containing protein [Candidatus Reidiella endopervernicosa]OOZ40338.1 hypothetical protein BOW53_08170 [Solemya pervernicosa gill symbiont]QKQ24862.1 CZB domain-containing protein [Candidatus Reidiella endopervernicosa]
MLNRGRGAGEGVACGESEQLNFLEAIEAHVRWKIRLEAYIAGTSEEQLNAEVICKDDQCVLGKWIYGPGGVKYGELHKFVDLKDTHTHFHTSAGNVVRLVDGGDVDGARELLCKGEYAKLSHRIKAKLARLSLQLDED